MILMRKTHSSLTRVQYIPHRSMHKECKIKVNNLNINIVETGEGKKTLFLLPGTLGSTWTNFKPQIEKLPKLLPDFKIIAWDPPGYGKSIPPERSFTLKMFENDAHLALELMREMKQEKFSLLGWSAGGTTALKIAGQFPELIDKLIVVGCGAYITEKELQYCQARRDLPQWPASIRNELEQVYGAQRVAVMWSCWVDLLEKFVLERNGDFCKADVDGIKAPTFIVRGGKDPVIFAEHPSYLLKHIKRSQYHVFPEGAHSVHITDADEFNRLVTKFLLEN